VHNDLLIGVALVVFLGIASQLVAWRTRIPSILLLLGIGIIAGPVMGWVNVDALLGDLLFPVVSLSVAIILFEGGLSLRVSEVRDTGHVVRNLIIFGVLLTWILSAGTAYYVLQLELQLSILLGAVLVVTGPTVIIPLLKQIRPARRVSSILRWEGIIIDPVGAILAVLVFEEILAAGSEVGANLLLVVFVILRTILIGFLGGWVMAQLIIVLFERYIIPYPLQNPATIMFVVVAFTVSNLLQAESGLVTVTMMGFILANQNRVDLRHIVEFKENLQVLLISALFVLLAARLDAAILETLNWRLFVFIATIIFIERPLSVWLATIGSDLTWRERVFIGWMAPRGIVAAAVSSIFAAELAEQGFEEANLIVLYTFAVIISTVAVYSLTSGVLARFMGLAERQPQGVLVLGAHNWAIDMGVRLRELGFRVIMADSNARHISDAQNQELDTYYGNILSEVIVDDVDLGGVGRFLAMTPNDEINSLASLHFRNVFGQDEVYQLVSAEEEDEIPPTLSGRHLFGDHITYEYISQQYGAGKQIVAQAIDNVSDMQQRIREGSFIPLFVVNNDELHIWTQDRTPTLSNGETLLGLSAPPFTT
jgi:NhaP-type Na+/H+ or K+/H+ antiporter